MTIRPEDDHLPRTTTAALVHAHDTAAARFAALMPVLAPLARRRPDTPAPGDLLTLGRAGLRPAARIAAALGQPPLLPLHGPITAAALAAQCGLAASHLDRFRERYWRWMPQLADNHWAVPGWIAASMAEADAEGGDDADEMAADPFA